MSPGSRILAPLIAALAAAGCVAPPIARTPDDPKASPAAASPRPAASGLRATPPPLGVDGGPGTRPTAQGSLIGKIRGPVGLISDKGASLISDKGAGLVSNNGSSWRLAAVEEAPAGGLVVRLLGADGRPYADAAGKPLEAVTAADGSYAFTAAVPSRNFVVAAELPGGKGRLAALAVRPAGDRLVVDVDLASTVTASWVLDRLVAPQADPAATLDRLTAAAESDARTQAAAAVQARATALPATLDAAAAADLADALRREAPAFDAGLATIERILVPGGQRGLGEGLPAAEAALGLVRQLVVTPGGTTYIGCPQDGKIWKVGADGLLRTAVGKGVGAAEAAIDGRPGPGVALGPVRAMIADGADGLLFLEQGPAGARLIRLKADGTLASAGSLPGLALGTSLAAMLGGGGPIGMARVAAGTLILSAPASGAALAWLVPDGEAPRQVHAFDAAGTAILKQATRFAGDERGGVVIARAAAVRSTTLYRLDTATFALTPLPDPVLALDDRGRPITQGDGTLTIGGTPARTLRAPGLPALGAAYVVAGLGDDLLVATGDLVYRVGAAGVTPYAGLVEQPPEVPADRLGLRDPIAFAVDLTGRQHVYDDGSRALWTIGLDGVARRLAVLPDALGGAALEVTALRPAGDRLLLIDDAEVPGAPHRLLTFEPTGTPRELLRLSGAREAILDAGPAPGGGTYVLANEADVIRLLELDAAGAIKARHELDEEAAYERLAFGPAGEVWLASEEGLARWTAAGGEQPVPVPEAWSDDWDGDTWLAADARGRIYGTGMELWRFDPATGTVGPLAQDAASVDTAISAWLKFPGLDAAGNLFYLEQTFRQIRLKRAAELG